VFHVKHNYRVGLSPACSERQPATPISRRTVLLFIAVGPSVSLITSATATLEITPGATSLAGQLLVATSSMSDTRFDHAVILMARHTAGGAMGVTINRPIGQRPLADLLRDIGQDASGVDGEIHIFAGGPVEPQVGFILHDAEYHRPSTIDIDGRVSMTSDPAILRDIGRHVGPRKHLVAFGYAGWGPHQLENELALRAWTTTPDDPALVFDADRGAVWEAAMARAGLGP
jgi:putative transcriptional regulator